MAYPTEEQLAALTDKLEKGIQQLYDSGRYAEYLWAMSKFHNYSFGNALLILLQCPHASRVAGYTTWKKGFGRHVKRNESGIQILAPCPTRCYVWTEVKDPLTGAILRNPDGTPKRKPSSLRLQSSKSQRCSMSARRKAGNCQLWVFPG